MAIHYIRNPLSESSRNAFLSTINFCLEIWKVDLVELGNDKVWGSGGGYRDLRPYSCCGGLPPDEEMQWHVHHIKNCLTYLGEMQDFCNQLIDLIKSKGKELNKKKKQAIKRIEGKDITKTCFKYYEHERHILNCTNSKELAKKEEEITKEIEQLSSQAQADKAKRKKQEEENERLRKEEEKEWKRKEKEWKRKEKEWKEKMEQDKEKWEKETNKEIEENKKRQQSEKPNSQSQEEEKEFLRLISLIQDCQDLATLENNYQTVKNSPLYTNSKETFVGHGGDNKVRLDNFYTTHKNLLQPNRQRNNSSTQQQPLIDTTKIEQQTESVGEATSIIKTQITQALKKYNLKISDLPKKNQNWEEQLTKLTTKEQVNSLAAEINQQIENTNRELKRKQNHEDNSQQSSLSLTAKLFIGGGISLLVILFVFLMLKKNRLSSKQN